MNTIICPYCNKPVTLVFYGGGWVGTCCDRVLYNSHKLPEKESEDTVINNSK